MSTTTECELESRVRELTESLIQKQTMVEALSTEKNSLGLQLERLGVCVTKLLYLRKIIIILVFLSRLSNIFKGAILIT